MSETFEALFKKAEQFILENDDFLVISHVNPDGDAIGSSMAVAHLLSNLGKKYVVANDGPISRRFSFMTGVDHMVNLSETMIERTFSNVITVDVADYGRIGIGDKIISKESQILNIDHHPTNTRFGQLDIIQSSAASTTEILYDFINQCYPHIVDYKIAEALYTGLLTDTGGFRYSNTTQSVLEMAASLLKYGVKPSQIAENALESISTTYLTLLKRVLQSLTLSLNEKVAFLSVTLQDLEETKASKDDADGLVSFPRNIEGVEVGALFKEVNEREVKVSLRSKSLDVGSIAQKFNGGGHAKASGYTFFGSLEEAREQLIVELKQVMGD
jgi:phosphoesterase RecJ-like protein